MFGNKKGLEQKLRAHGGTVAWATIIKAEEKWRSARDGDVGFGGPGHVTDHMQVTVRVEPDAAPPFEATFRQAFPGLTPVTGGRAKVIYDPADHGKIAIMDGEVYMPGVSVEKQQRSRAHVAEAEAAAQSGHLAEYIEQRKAEAMRNASVVIGGGMVPPGAAPQPSVVDQLSKLADLHDRGVLTDAEFQAQKAKLLAES